MSAIWMRAHELGQPLTCTDDGVCREWGRSVEFLTTSRRGERFVSTIASLQYSMPVHAIDAAVELTGLGVQLQCAQSD